MPFLKKLRRTIFGAPLDPLSSSTRERLALVAFLAWVGLGADGLSSANYGPEETFRALGEHTHLALYLALATAVTVFIIALAYNQVIELFPTGGGGYRVATRLLGPHAGLVAGAALILDYVLTIAISIASGIDALFSFLPVGLQPLKLWVGLLFLGVLMTLNLRGMRETIKVLLPVFLGFVLTHVALIIYGIVAHAGDFPRIFAATTSETVNWSKQIGWFGVAAALLLAYSQGGGTYTGLEAVSNNVNVLAEPRVRTGKITMFFMATSLAFAASGIIMLYLLWDAKHIEGQTLNAVVFTSIIADWGFAPWLNKTILVIVLLFAAGLLFVAANTGFLGGPSVLANMAADSWVPHKFRYLSTRLVTQNGILMMGLGALAILWWTGGSVTLLVVLYSISVFLTFALSLFGLCKYWVTHRQGPWLGRLALSSLGFVVCFSILIVLLIEKFTQGGWAAILIIGAIVALCLYIEKHYRQTKHKIKKVDEIFCAQPFGADTELPPLDVDAPTACFIVGSSRGGGVHTLLWVQRMFPNHFKNFIFINARTVDVQSFGGEETAAKLKREANATLDYLVKFCASYGLPAKSYVAFGTDAIHELTNLAQKINREFPNTIFFTSKLIFENDNWFTRLLHNQAALALQRRYHFKGMQMVILPMKI